MSTRLRRRTRRRMKAEGEPAEADVAPALLEGKPAYGPRIGAMTVGAPDGYQYRDDHSWDKDDQQTLAKALEDVAREAAKKSLPAQSSAAE